MYNYTPLTNLATSMPAIVARSVIASRNSDPPPSENLTNTAQMLSRSYIYLTNCREQQFNQAEVSLPVKMIIIRGGRSRRKRRMYVSRLCTVYFKATSTSYFACVLYLLYIIIDKHLSDPRSDDPAKVNQTFGRRLINSLMTHFAHPPQKKLQKLISAKFWFDFRHQSPLVQCCFKTRELGWNLMHSA